VLQILHGPPSLPSRCCCGPQPTPAPHRCQDDHPHILWWSPMRTQYPAQLFVFAAS
jgi:hypothetical protein